MVGVGCHMGVGLNQKQYIIKGMICRTGLHLVNHKRANAYLTTYSLWSAMHELSLLLNYQVYR